MPPSPVRNECLHASAVHRIRDPDAGANGNGTIALDYGFGGLPVADIRKPILKSTAKEMRILVVDRHCAHGSRNIVRECEDGTRPNPNDRSVTCKSLEILAVQGWQFARSAAGFFDA